MPEFIIRRITQIDTLPKKPYFPHSPSPDNPPILVRLLPASLHSSVNNPPMTPLSNPQRMAAARRDKRRVIAIKVFTSKNIGSGLHARDVAVKFQWSVSSFHRFFKKHHGTSWHVYLEEVRIKKALKLLKNDHLRVKEAMYATGYTNRSSFNKAFKKRYHHPPGYFKK